MAILRLISALYITSTQNNILLLDPSPDENYDVSFGPHKTTENITIFLTFTKSSHLKWEEMLKIDRLKSPKCLTSNKKKQKSFP